MTRGAYLIILLLVCGAPLYPFVHRTLISHPNGPKGIATPQPPLRTHLPTAANLNVTATAGAARLEPSSSPSPDPSVSPGGSVRRSGLPITRDPFPPEVVTHDNASSDRGFGCKEIAAMPLDKLLGHGCISFAYQSSYKGQIVVVKKPNVNFDCAPLRVRNHQFWNLVKWAKMRVQHPYLMPILGYCDDPKQLSIVVPFQAPVHPRKFLNMSLQTRMSGMLNLAELLHFSTNKYVLCDLRQDQFGLSHGHYVYQDLDMIYSLTSSDPLGPSPAGLRCHVSQHRFCPGVKCSSRKKCPYGCLFSVIHDDISELTCSAHKPCSGVGSPAMMYVFARRFLRYYLGDCPDARLGPFIEKCMSHNPADRPPATQAVTLLRDILQAYAPARAAAVNDSGT